MTGFDLGRAHRFLNESRDAYLADLEALVNIDSGTFDKAGVDRVGELLQALYRQLGASIERHPDETYGDAFTVVFEGKGEGTVLLLGHMDTVYPDGTIAERPFRVEGDRAWGPGTADMKAGDLSIVYALKALIQQEFSGFGHITVVHNSDEEIGSPASKQLIRGMSEQADAVLVLESGRENGDIVSARKGVARFHLRVRGRSAHAGVNHAHGRSAALELAHLVVGLEGLNGRVPGATLNVGRLEAGHRTNIVPDWAVAHLEARAYEVDRLEEVIVDVREVVAQRTVPETEVDLEVDVDHFPMHKSPVSERLVRLAQALAGELGFSVHDTATGGASDGNTAASAGRPVLDGLGPVGGAAHSPHEYIDITTIAPRTAVLAGLIARIGTRDW